MGIDFFFLSQVMNILTDNNFILVCFQQMTETSKISIFSPALIADSKFTKLHKISLQILDVNLHNDLHSAKNCPEYWRLIWFLKPRSTHESVLAKVLPLFNP